MKRFVLTTHSDGNPIVVGLRTKGFDVRRIDWPCGDSIELEGCIGFYGNLFGEIKRWIKFPILLKQLKEKNIPYVFWNRDAPWDTGIKFHNRFFMRHLKPVDIYLAHSLQDHQDYGGRAFYFPNAAQPAYYESTILSQLRDEAQYEHDVSFFGSMGGRDQNAQLRLEFLNQLADALKQKIPEIRIFYLDTAKNQLTVDEQLRLIRTSKINLNVGAMCDRPGKPTWGLPERVFGIPAAGGCPLTDFRKSLSLSFGDDVYPSFRSLEEAVFNICHMLGHFEATRETAEILHGMVLKEHTYMKRAEEFMGFLGVQDQTCAS